MVSSTFHDRLVRADYLRLAEFGIRTVREGARWHLIAQKTGRFDFSTVLPFLEAAREFDIQIIWDLFHFGWPHTIDIFSAGWVSEFAWFASEFATMLGRNGFNSALIIPVNEVSFFSWAGGEVAYINPFEKGRGAELKAQMVRGWIAAVRAMRSVLPSFRVVSAEPVIHIKGNPRIPGDVEAAENYRRSMFEAWDMILGRAHPELGGAREFLDVIGVNFYDRNEWWNFGATIRRGQPDYRPFHQILLEAWERYRLPMFVSETGTEDEDRPAWLNYIAKQTEVAMFRGVPVEGICLYPILNHPGWEDNRHCRNGLWDYPLPTGERPVYEPLAHELERLELEMLQAPLERR